MSERTPRDLAMFVFARLEDTPSRPSVDVLNSLFQTLFLASLKTEEGTPIVCSIAYCDPKCPDPDPPQLLRDQRWRYFPLDKPLDFDVGHLTKLALASAPTSSSIAVYPDRSGKLKIWGLFDQQGGFQSMLRYESDRGFSPPGLLQAQIVQIGHLIVMDDSKVIAELNGAILVQDSVDVFQGPAVFDKLRAGIEIRIAEIERRVHAAGFPYDPDRSSFVVHNWINIIRRILLRAKGFGHGGAFLLTDSDYEEKLNVKYGLKYDRLPSLFDNWMCSSIVEHLSFSALRDQLDKEETQISPQVYFDQACAECEGDDAMEALTGAVDLISSLSRVDGLVLLDTNLVVHGFGCEIKAKGSVDCKYFHADSAIPSKGVLKKLDLQRFGTRHRSMGRYCSEDLSSVGFVLSSDGPVRAFSRMKKRLYFWDNVQLVREGP